MSSAAFRRLAPAVRGAVVPLATALLGSLPGASILPAQPQGSLAGSVLDEQTERPLQGATVVLLESQSEATTDEDGSFSFEGVDVGTLTVRIEKDGYSTLLETLEILSGEVALVQFHLLPISAVLEGLVVVAEGNPDARARGHAESALSVGNLGGGTAIDLLLQRVPGLSVTHSDGEVGAGVRISLRGVSSATLPDDPAIYLDGVRINEGGTTGAIQVLDQIPASSVARIRILRGPVATMRYPLAAAGVILIETRAGGDGGL